MGEHQVGPANLLSDFTSNKSPVEKRLELPGAAPPPGELCLCVGPSH